jgi:hypothetical protein
LTAILASVSMPTNACSCRIQVVALGTLPGVGSGYGGQLSVRHEAQ